MLQNLLLQEAMESATLKIDPIVASIKKTLNTCKLTKFRSASQCAQFYSSFFLCTLEDGQTPTVEQWGTIYTNLLSSDPFCVDLASFIALYQPAVYTGIFMPLWTLINSELAHMKSNQVRYLAQVKAMIMMIHTRVGGACEMVKAQVNDPNAIKFITVIDQTLTKFEFDLSALTQQEIEKAAKPEDIVYTKPIKEVPLAEDVQEFIDLLEHCGEWISNREQELLAEAAIINEGIVSNAKERAKQIMVAHKKAENEFDEFVTRKVKKIREERRNKKHAEMVGEALRINREIKRLLRSGAIGILNPAWGAISFIVSVVYDRATDKRDRAVLVGQLKDELEIVEEKIQMAERNGDEKARIELIRFRQKLHREYERIMRVRYDANTRAKINSQQMS